MRNADMVVFSVFMFVLSHASEAAPKRYLSASLLFPVFVRATDAAAQADPSLASQLRSARTAFGILAENLERLPGGVPHNYERVFALYAREVDYIAAHVGSAPAERQAALLLEDIETKNKFLTDGFGFAIRNKAQVTVRVKTLSRDGKPASGYEVSCNPRRFANTKPALFTFGKLTPTQMAMPPGSYTLKISYLGEAIASKDVNPGMSGADFEDVEVAVPRRTK